MAWQTGPWRRGRRRRALLAGLRACEAFRMRKVGRRFAHLANRRGFVTSQRARTPRRVTSVGRPGIDRGRPGMQTSRPRMRVRGQVMRVPGPIAWMRGRARFRPRPVTRTIGRMTRPDRSGRLGIRRRTREIGRASLRARPRRASNVGRRSRPTDRRATHVGSGNAIGRSVSSPVG